MDSDLYLICFIILSQKSQWPTCVKKKYIFFFGLRTQFPPVLGSFCFLSKSFLRFHTVSIILWNYNNKYGLEAFKDRMICLSVKTDDLCIISLSHSFYRSLSLLSPHLVSETCVPNNTAERFSKKAFLPCRRLSLVRCLPFVLFTMTR